jgi:hypothetical protein
VKEVVRLRCGCELEIDLDRTLTLTRNGKRRVPCILIAHCATHHPERISQP